MDKMKDIVKEIIELAQECVNGDNYEMNDIGYKLADIAKNLIDEMAETINCPSNWRDIGEELFVEYKDNDWVLDNCYLYEYED